MRRRGIIRRLTAYEHDRFFKNLVLLLIAALLLLQLLQSALLGYFVHLLLK